MVEAPPAFHESEECLLFWYMQPVFMSMSRVVTALDLRLQSKKALLQEHISAALFFPCGFWMVQGMVLLLESLLMTRYVPLMREETLGHAD
jgi:predicted Co/Zn/Cd cation transporter (cation efflux family)